MVFQFPQPDSYPEEGEREKGGGRERKVVEVSWLKSRDAWGIQSFLGGVVCYLD